jgi:hypothetical protein
MRRHAVLLLMMVGLLVALVFPAFADGPPPHDHFLLNPATGERTQVGPHRCELGETVQGAFLNFHGNVHVGVPRDAGLVLQAEFCQ